MARRTSVCGQRKSLLLLAGLACLALLSTSQAASGRALLGKKSPAPSPSPIPADARKGMGWVGGQFPLTRKSKCDSTFYHSSLTLNISRPDRWSFCFDIATATPNGKYSCHAAPTAGQVDTVQVLSTNDCSKAVDSVTVDGKAWSDFSFSKTSNILSINNLADAPVAAAGNPSKHTVCVALDPTAATCNSINEFCAPTYGPNANACGVMITDAAAADGESSCCPVYRSIFGDVPVQASYTFAVSGRFTGKGFNCGLLKDSDNITAQFEQALVTAYAKALKTNSSQFKVMDTSCRARSFEAVIKMAGLTDPDAVLKSSGTYLRSVAKTLGFEKVKAVPYVPSPPASPKPKTPKPAPSPSPNSQGFNETIVPTPSPVTGPSPAPAPVPSPVVNGPSPVPGPSPSPSPAAGPTPSPTPSPAVYPIVPVANTPPSPVPSYGSSPSPSQQQSPAPSYGSPQPQQG